MIITCPSCSARYLVGSNDIGHGRQVKCNRCDFSWFQDNDSFVEGVEDLIEIAVKKGKKENKSIKLGICGEHGGDPKSIYFCSKVGLNYVSCSPYRVPIARLAAAQAELIKNNT